MPFKKISYRYQEKSENGSVQNNSRVLTLTLTATNVYLGATTKSITYKDAEIGPWPVSAEMVTAQIMSFMRTQIT